MIDSASLTLHAVPGLPEIVPGVDLAATIADAIDATSLDIVAGDVLVVSHKIVSKAEGRVRRLDEVEISAQARELAERSEKDPRAVQIILDESTDIVRVRPGLIIARHRNGNVMANAGIDQSNLGAHNDGEAVLCLPRDADASAVHLLDSLRSRYRTQRLGVVICDSVGRAWRRGVVGQALGVAGLPALVDRRGERDRQGRELKVTYSALADQIASAAELLMGEAAEGRPVVLVRGVPWHAADVPASELLRPPHEDLFT